MSETLSNLSHEERRWDAERDVWWHELVGSASAEHEAEAFDAEHPLYVMYTSGTTGKPEGQLDTSTPYMGITDRPCAQRPLSTSTSSHLRSHSPANR